VRTAVKMLFGEKNALFMELIQAVENDAYLYELIYDVLITGNYRRYDRNVDCISAGEKVGLIKQTDGDMISKIAPELDVASNGMRMTNRIYEMLFCKYFISQTDAKPIPNALDINCGRRFDMETCLCEFAEYYAEASENKTAEYLENNIRLMFLAYLKEYMSIYGFCYIDSGNTDICRIDIVAEVNGEQYIIELRTWRGDERCENRLYSFAEYLAGRGKTRGYLVAFDFRQDAEKEPKAAWADIAGQKIFYIRV